MKGKKSVDPLNGFTFGPKIQEEPVKGKKKKAEGPAKLSPWDYAEVVGFSKDKSVFSKDTEKDYNIFMMNRVMSGTADTLFHAQELNTFSKIGKEEHFRYLLHALPRKKRYSKWVKEEKDERIPMIQEYYNGCSIPKAKEILKMLSQEQLQYIEKYLNKGGAGKQCKTSKTKS